MFNFDRLQMTKGFSIEQERMIQFRVAAMLWRTGETRKYDHLIKMNLVSGMR